MFGGGAGTWPHVQTAFDAWHAKREVDVSDVKALKAA